MCSRSSASKPRCDVIGCVHWTIWSLQLENNKAEADHDRKRTSAFGEPGRLKVHSRVGSWCPARSTGPRSRGLHAPAVFCAEGTADHEESSPSASQTHR